MVMVPTFLHGIPGVEENIIENLLHLSAVDENGVIVFRDVKTNFNLSSFQFRLNELDDIVDKVTNVGSQTLNSGELCKLQKFRENFLQTRDFFFDDRRA